MNFVRTIALCGAAAIAFPATIARADEAADASSANDRDDATILVTAARNETFAGTKTETPLIETPQPITIVTDDQYLSQGAINISDTVRYTAGVTANP